MALIKQGDVDGVKSILGLSNDLEVSGDRGDVDLNFLYQCVEPLEDTFYSSSSSHIKARKPKSCTNNESYETCHLNEFCQHCPLEIAFKYKHVDIIKLLLENGARGDSHLDDAIKMTNVDIVRLIVSQGEVDVNKLDWESILCVAAYAGGAEEEIYWGIEDVDDIDEDASDSGGDDGDDDSEGLSSSFDGNRELEELFAESRVPLEQLQAIQASLPPYEDDDDDDNDNDDDDDSDDNEDNVNVGDTKNKRLMEVIRFLVEEAGADVNLAMTAEEFERRGWSKRPEKGYGVITPMYSSFGTPLCTAAITGFADCVDYFIEKGANVNTRELQQLRPYSCDTNGRSPLDYARYSGSTFTSNRRGVGNYYLKRTISLEMRQRVVTSLLAAGAEIKNEKTHPRLMRRFPRYLNGHESRVIEAMIAAEVDRRKSMEPESANSDCRNSSTSSEGILDAAAAEMTSSSSSSSSSSPSSNQEVIADADAEAACVSDVDATQINLAAAEAWAANAMRDDYELRIRELMDQHAGRLQDQQTMFKAALAMSKGAATGLRKQLAITTSELNAALAMSKEVATGLRRQLAITKHQQQKHGTARCDKANATVSVPSLCCVCDDPLVKNTVAFTCECLTGFCGSCALEQIANQPSAYSKGVNCVVCRQPSDNVQGKEACKAAEDTLVEAAAVHYGVRIRTPGSVPSLERLLEKLNADGYIGTVTSLSHLHDPEEAEFMVRLDIARLEYARELLSRQKPEQRGSSSSAGGKKRARDDATAGLSFLEDDDADLALSAKDLLSHKEKREMFLGPMNLLKISRNVALERAIEMQRLMASNT